MHGVGTFEAPNGARYQGGWALNVKHGLGKQSFSNGDVYEGIWKNGVPDGPGRYKVSRILNSDRRSGDEVRLPNQSNTARCSLGTSPSMRIRRVCCVFQIPIPPLRSPNQVVRTHQTNPIMPSFPPLHPPPHQVVLGLRVRRRVAGGQVPWPGQLCVAMRREVRRGMEGGAPRGLISS